MSASIVLSIIRAGNGTILPSVLKYLAGPSSRAALRASAYGAGGQVARSTLSSVGRQALQVVNLAGTASIAIDVASVLYDLLVRGGVSSTVSEQSSKALADPQTHVRLARSINFHLSDDLDNQLVRHCDEFLALLMSEDAGYPTALLNTAVTPFVPLLAEKGYDVQVPTMDYGRERIDGAESAAVVSDFELIYFTVVLSKMMGINSVSDGMVPAAFDEILMFRNDSGDAFSAAMRDIEAVFPASQSSAIRKLAQTLLGDA